MVELTKYNVYDELQKALNQKDANVIHQCTRYLYRRNIYFWEEAVAIFCMDEELIRDCPLYQGA